MVGMKMIWKLKIVKMATAKKKPKKNSLTTQNVCKWPPPEGVTVQQSAVERNEVAIVAW